jgi:hypothetical protein
MFQEKNEEILKKIINIHIYQYLKKRLSNNNYIYIVLLTLKVVLLIFFLLIIASINKSILCIKELQK